MRQRFGHLFTRIGLVGALMLTSAFALTGYALAHGVHCPECDSNHLTSEQFEFWKRYFVAKDGVYGAATVLLLVASPLATPRRWPFIMGFVLALIALSVTPR